MDGSTSRIATGPSSSPPPLSPGSTRRMICRTRSSPLAGFHAQDDLVLPASHGVGSNVGVGQSLRPMDFTVCRLLAVDEYPVGLPDLAQIHIQLFWELGRQSNRCPVPANALIALVALLLPGQPDADRLPACLFVIRRIPVMTQALIARIGGKSPRL